MVTNIDVLPVDQLTQRHAGIAQQIMRELVDKSVNRLEAVDTLRAKLEHTGVMYYEARSCAAYMPLGLLVLHPVAESRILRVPYCMVDSGFRHYSKQERGHGIGSLLIAKAIQVAKIGSYSSIELKAANSSESFYKKHGFERIGKTSQMRLLVEEV